MDQCAKSHTIRPAEQSSRTLPDQIARQNNTKESEKRKKKISERKQQTVSKQDEKTFVYRICSHDRGQVHAHSRRHKSQWHRLLLPWPSEPDQATSKQSREKKLRRKSSIIS